MRREGRERVVDLESPLAVVASKAGFVVDPVIGSELIDEIDSLLAGAAFLCCSSKSHDTQYRPPRRRSLHPLYPRISSSRKLKKTRERERESEWVSRMKQEEEKGTEREMGKSNCWELWGAKKQSLIKKQRHWKQWCCPNLQHRPVVAEANLREIGGERERERNKCYQNSDICFLLDCLSTTHLVYNSKKDINAFLTVIFLKY